MAHRLSPPPAYSSTPSGPAQRVVLATAVGDLHVCVAARGLVISRPNSRAVVETAVIRLLFTHPSSRFMLLLTRASTPPFAASLSAYDLGSMRKRWGWDGIENVQVTQETYLGSALYDSWFAMPVGFTRIALINLSRCEAHWLDMFKEHPLRSLAIRIGSSKATFSCGEGVFCCSLPKIKGERPTIIRISPDLFGATHIHRMSWLLADGRVHDIRMPNKYAEQKIRHVGCIAYGLLVVLQLPTIQVWDLENNALYFEMSALGHPVVDTWGMYGLTRHRWVPCDQGLALLDQFTGNKYVMKKSED